MSQLNGQSKHFTKQEGILLSPPNSVRVTESPNHTHIVHSSHHQKENSTFGKKEQLCVQAQALSDSVRALGLGPLRKNKRLTSLPAAFTLRITLRTKLALIHWPSTTALSERHDHHRTQSRIGSSRFSMSQCQHQLNSQKILRPEAKCYSLTIAVADSASGDCPFEHPFGSPFSHLQAMQGRK